MERGKVAAWRAEGLSLVSAEALLYRVDIGYGEIGSGENFPLGQWEGRAESAAHAEELAMDAIWDARLDVVCGPRIKVKQINDSAEVSEGMDGG
jgi:hypothetical protein